MIFVYVRDCETLTDEKKHKLPKTNLALERELLSAISATSPSPSGQRRPLSGSVMDWRNA